MDSIQRMAPEGSRLVALAQQGAEAANFIIAQWLADNPRGEPFIGNRSGKKRLKWSSNIDGQQPSSSRQRRALADEVDDPSTTFSSKRCHPIQEGQFLFSGSITQAGRLVKEIHGWAHRQVWWV
jgi:hypothetical protein